LQATTCSASACKRSTSCGCRYHGGAARRASTARPRARADIGVWCRQLLFWTRVDYLLDRHRLGDVLAPHLGHLDVALVLVGGVLRRDVHPDHSDRCTPKVEPPRPWAHRRAAIDVPHSVWHPRWRGAGNYRVRLLANKPLIPNASASELIRLSIVMIFFVALVEDLLFRVLLQPQFIERSGAVAGILITSVLFGALHAIYGNVYTFHVHSAQTRSV
jgi:hypothetical protein